MKEKDLGSNISFVVLLNYMYALCLCTFNEHLSVCVKQERSHTSAQTVKSVFLTPAPTVPISAARNASASFLSTADPDPRQPQEAPKPLSVHHHRCHLPLPLPGHRPGTNWTIVNPCRSSCQSHRLNLSHWTMSTSL